MRENKYLYTSLRSVIKWMVWFLFGTGFSLNSMAQSIDSSDETYYDSSIQRSNFLTLNPDYYNQLEAEVAGRRTKLFWKLRFDGQSISTDDNINSQIAGANLVGKFSHKFIQDFEFKAKASLNLESGRSQAIFGDQEPGSGIYPREVLVQYTPFQEYLQVQAGLIQQRFFGEQLFVSRLPFMGFSEKVGISGKRYDVGVRLQQLIPTSYTNATRVSEREDIPYFYTESLEGGLKISRYNFVRGRLTHFRFENLPSVVAFDSFLYGNTVTNTDVNNAEFIYGFEGWLTSLSFEQKFTDAFSAQLHWNTIVNNKAPSDAGEAQTIGGTLAYDAGRWIFAGLYKNYFIESDAVPASYNSHLYGHNNRIGQGIGFRIESKDWGVHFIGDYVDADLLNQSPRRIDGLQQDNQQTIYFAVETMYDFI